MARKLKRVISLVPSCTELLFSIIEKTSKQPCPVTLVGRSHECDYPVELVKHIPMLTSAKTTFSSSRQTNDLVESILTSTVNPTSLYKSFYFK